MRLHELAVPILLIAMYFILFYTFILGYLSPTRSVEVFVNYYGEANIELVALSLTTIYILYYVYCKIHDSMDISYNRNHYKTRNESDSWTPKR